MNYGLFHKLILIIMTFQAFSWYNDVGIDSFLVGHIALMSWGASFGSSDSEGRAESFTRWFHICVWYIATVYCMEMIYIIYIQYIYYIYLCLEVNVALYYDYILPAYSWQQLLILLLTCLLSLLLAKLTFSNRFPNVQSPALLIRGPWWNSGAEDTSSWWSPSKQQQKGYDLIWPQ